MNKIITGMGCAYLLFIALIVFTVGSICWPYVITAWALYYGKTVVIAWWQGGLIGLVPGVGQLAVPLTVITWILMLILI